LSPEQPFLEHDAAGPAARHVPARRRQHRLVRAQDVGAEVEPEGGESARGGGRHLGVGRQLLGRGPAVRCRGVGRHGSGGNSGGNSASHGGGGGGSGGGGRRWGRLRLRVRQLQRGRHLREQLLRRGVLVDVPH
jgi:hypothetical protein